MMRSRYAVMGLVVAIAVLIGGCGGGEAGTVRDVRTAVESAEQRSDTATPGAGASTTSENPRGIVTSSEVKYNDPNPVRIGVIDPDTGTYRRLFTFSYSTSDEFRFLYNGGKPSVDPTVQRIAIHVDRKGAGERFGWIDRAGVFTDVTPDATRGDDFGGGTEFSVFGFDGVGDYYFSSSVGKKRSVFRVPAGQTKPVPAPFDQFPNGNEYVTLPDGRFSFLVADLNRYSCIRSNSAPWVGSKGYVTVGAPGMSDQLYYNTALSGNCAADRRELLPESNTMRVFNPISAPDGASVVVRAANGSIYRVAIDGKSRPSKISADGFGANGAEVLVHWVP